MEMINPQEWKKDLPAFKEKTDRFYAGELSKADYKGFSGGYGSYAQKDGKAEKSTYSNKGIKADNNIEIKSGKIFIKSHDDAIHANGDEELENGEKGLGNITISGGEK